MPALCQQSHGLRDISLAQPLVAAAQEPCQGPARRARRQGRAWAPQDARDGERLLGRLLQLLRAGRPAAAAQLCRDVGQPWRAACLAGAGAGLGPVPVGDAAAAADAAGAGPGRAGGGGGGGRGRAARAVALGVLPGARPAGSAGRPGRPPARATPTSPAAIAGCAPGRVSLS